MRQARMALGAMAAAMALGAAAPVKAQDIVIATIGPMTGGEAVFGEQMKRGLEMAVADLNAKGGLLGRKIKAVVEDDACDPKQARAAAEKVAAMKVSAVIGHYCSSSSIPASEVYADAKILQITPASTNPRLTDEAAKKGWVHVHRTCGRDDQQGGIAGRFMAQKFKGKKVAILHDKTTYGQGLADETKKAMEKAGLKAAAYEAFTKGDKDFTALITKLKSAKVDAVYIGSYNTEIALIVRQSAEQGFKPTFLTGDSLATDEFWKIAGAAGTGVMMTFPPDPRNIAGAKDVVARFKAEKYDPEGYTLYTYAAVQVWAEAVKKASTLDMKKLSQAIRSSTFSTVVGPIKYDKKGDITGNTYVWYSWKDGKYAEIKAGS
ncbi:MAG: branched-chain amino acid ABC transporter substrate-binding protein [Alphaproteobacteria bacterium]|nr:branched-chain amino acid ABC transporter substrate-binding protein [Alphaproteobacteria bacterium]